MPVTHEVAGSSPVVPAIDRFGGFFATFFYFFFSFFFFLTSFLFSSQAYFDSRYGLNLLVPDLWKVTSTPSGETVTLFSSDHTATATIRVFVNGPSVSSLYTQRDTGLYDGYMSLLYRKFSDSDLRSFVAEDGVVCVYSKQFLMPNLQVREDIFGDYIFSSGSFSYILSFRALKSSFLTFQKTFDAIRDSVWIGQGIRPYVFKNPVSTWLSQSGNAGFSSSIVADPSLSSVLLTRFTTVLPSSSALLSLPLIVSDVALFPFESGLQAVSATSGVMLWQQPLPLSSEMAASEAVIYVVPTGSSSVLALDVATSRLLFSVPLFSPFTRVVSALNRLFLLDPFKLRCLDSQTGEELWRVSGAFSTSFLPRVSSSFLVISSESGALLSLNAYTGQTLKTLPFYTSELLYQPSMEASFLILSSTSSIQVFDLERFETRFSIGIPSSDVLLFQPSTCGDFLMYSTRRSLKTVLTCVSLQTGRILWEKSGLGALQVRPVLTDRLAFILYETRGLVAYKLSSGELVSESQFASLDPPPSSSIWFALPYRKGILKLFSFNQSLQFRFEE